jgi:uncharacterized protein (TIGR03066 family)
MRRVNMSSVRIALFGILAILLVGAPLTTAQEEKKDEKPKLSNKDKIVGAWEYVKQSAPGPLPLGAIFEFSKDGTVKVTVTSKPDNKTTTSEAKYELDGDTLTMLAKGEKPVSAKIKTLTDKELVWESTGDPKKMTMEFKKK